MMPLLPPVLLASAFCSSSLSALSTQSVQGRFGATVAAADVDGDGLCDVIVGEPLFTRSAAGEGRVLVFHGSANGPESTPRWSRRGFQAGAHFGAAVAAAGDVNADGFGDVAIGAPGYDTPLYPGGSPGTFQHTQGSIDSGALVVYLGSPSGLRAAPVLVRPGLLPDQRLGRAVTGAGDVDGDGFHDVLVGAAGFDHARGAAFLFPGSAGGTVRLPSWRAFGPWRDSGFGSAIAAGDVNGDGHRDVLIGAPDAGPARRGAAFAYHGSASGLPEFPSTTFSPPGGHDGYDNGNSDWGTSLCLADMNGDGFDDALIDNPTHDTNLGHGSGVYPDSGILVIHRGTPAGIGPFAGGFSGITRSCAPVGDLNADGRDDVSIQLTTYDFVATYFALVVYGSSQRVPIESKICTGGDVDGDGVDDLVASDPAFDAGKGIVRIHRGVAGALISSTETWTLTAP